MSRNNRSTIQRDITEGFYSSGYLTYRQGLRLKNSTFCPHTVLVCFVFISEQTAIISLHSINWLVFITETVCLLRGMDWIYIKFRLVLVCSKFKSNELVVLTVTARHSAYSETKSAAINQIPPWWRPQALHRVLTTPRNWIIPTGITMRQTDINDN